MHRSGINDVIGSGADTVSRLGRDRGSSARPSLRPHDAGCRSIWQQAPHRPARVGPRVASSSFEVTSTNTT
ncbi:hypothetical protein BHE74_00043507 [Ensete ventricosum]|uniref:Uncharacterized protein n=1 Tax=Ensete ventricosum TaxID=4639 RepID=A0A426Z4B6_ENSVE|nr:hypothetical protein B296_00013654 [Ensete ventricosum]RWW34422.1 hypothetical protein GW17_00000838 [Ensete ventricosum]RWW50250.1 hypothetical protein BHE74_00043507 [Ensete ventricosum]RZR94025.1 hypothetical protein BHM03_00022625 [Ensete ventricosum]